MIEMGAAADPKLLKAAAAEAHHKAIGSISGPNGVTSRADWDSPQGEGHGSLRLCEGHHGPQGAGLHEVAGEG